MLRKLGTVSGLTLASRILGFLRDVVLAATLGAGPVASAFGSRGPPRGTCQLEEALDISEGMLEVARSKNVYSAFHVAALGDPLPMADNTYAAVVAAGVFTVGHVGQEGFDELIRITRPGGFLVVTIKDSLYKEGLGDYLKAREAKGVWTIVEETPSYVSMPGRPDTVPSRAVVLKIS